MAKNLLDSYRYFAKDPLPFAIVCEEENQYTKCFDDVIVLDHPTRSYMDKIKLLVNVPYENTIFIEADCLIYGDINRLFDVFLAANSGFSVQGRKMPRDAQDGWFRISECGKYASRISNTNKMHSGMLFFKKDDPMCKGMYDICVDVEKHFDEYMIGGNRGGVDDKLLSISLMSHPVFVGLFLLL